MQIFRNISLTKNYGHRFHNGFRTFSDNLHTTPQDLKSKLQKDVQPLFNHQCALIERDLIINELTDLVRGANHEKRQVAAEVLIRLSKDQNLALPQANKEKLQEVVLQLNSEFAFAHINTSNLQDLEIGVFLAQQASNVEAIEGTTEFKTRMNLGYMIIYTADVVSSVEFYEKAFNLNRGFVHDSKQYAEMETGQTKLAFVSDELISKSLPISYHKNIKSEVPAGIEVVFVTKDIEKAYTNAVKNGATPVKEPVEKPWGQMVGYVRDNNGVVIELASPLDERLDFGYVIVYTANVADSVQFYEKAFNMKPGFLHESGQYAEMDTGHTKLAFVSDELISQGLPIPYRKNIQSEVPAGVEVVLVAKDIENAYTHAIKNGATPVKKPEEKPWGQKVGYVRDNNGVVIELTTPIG